MKRHPIETKVLIGVAGLAAGLVLGHWLATRQATAVPTSLHPGLVKMAKHYDYVRYSETYNHGGSAKLYLSWQDGDTEVSLSGEAVVEKKLLEWR